MTDSNTVDMRLFDLFHLRHWPVSEQAVPVAFVPGRAKGDWETTDDDLGILGQAAKLYADGRIDQVAIPGIERRGETNYLGAKTWMLYLDALGVKKEFVVPTKGEGRNTRTEMDDFVELAQQRGWTDALVLVNPHQVLRVMLGALKSFEGIGHHMTLRPVTHKADWNAQVYGSQGHKKLPRALHILEEWRRVVEYQAKGDLASFDELSDYYANKLGVSWPER